MSATHPGIANIFTRVLKIETDQGALATAFTIEVGDTQYLVTARHVVPGKGPHKFTALGHTVQFGFAGAPIPGIPSNVDIAVFKLPEPVTAQYELPATLVGMTYAHEVYFYGYPWGLSSTAAGAERFPLVKRALMSAMMHEEGRSHSLPRRVQQSGILGRPGDVRAIRQAALHVGAVIAGYRPDLLEVKSADDAVSGLVAVNSEIVVAYSIDHAVAAVEGRPAEIPPPPEGDKPQPVP